MKDATAARMAMQPVAPPRILTGQAVETLQSIAHEMIASRAYELYEARGSEAGHELDDWVQAEKELNHVERLEVVDTGHDIRIRAGISAFDPGDVLIGVSPQRVIILGDKTARERANAGSADGKAVLLETVDLVPKVSPSEAIVSFADGVLELILPLAS